jgi:hypothetical protein
VGRPPGLDLKEMSTPSKLLMHSFRLMTWHASWFLNGPLRARILHKEIKCRVEERPGVSRRGHSDA